MSQETQRPETPEEIAKAEAIAFNHFYKMNPDLNLTANTFLLRSTSKELGLDLITVADIKYVVDYLGAALARILPEAVVQESEPVPSYEERLESHNVKLATADSRTIKKLALIQALSKAGYTWGQISGELLSRGLSITNEELALLHPPTPDEGRDEGAAEFDSAAAHIGKLLGRGPVSAADIKKLSADETRKLLWPGGAGTPMNKQNEQMIDLILRGK